MDSINFLRWEHPNTYDLSKRMVIRNDHVLELPEKDHPNNFMDELRVRDFRYNAPRPRQVPTVDMIEEERLQKYGQRVDMDPELFIERLMKIVLKLPILDDNGVPIKDETGRMVYKNYTYKDVLASPILRQFRKAQLLYGKSRLAEAYDGSELRGDERKEIELLDSGMPSFDFKLKDEEKKEEKSRFTKEDLQSQIINRDRLIESRVIKMRENVDDNLIKVHTGGLKDPVSIDMMSPSAGIGRAVLDWLTRNLKTDMSPPEIYTAWIAFIGATYGTSDFDLGQGFHNFIHNNPELWLNRRNLIFEGATLYFDPEKGKRMQGNTKTVKLRLNQVKNVKSLKAAYFWFNAFHVLKNSGLSISKIQKAITFFLASTFGDGEWSIYEAMDELNDKGIEYWSRELEKREMTMEPEISQIE